MKQLTAQELRAAQLSILDKVVAFCAENGLTYYLTGGTLIGAVRHKGYIPWDDDIDLNMPREDYDVFFARFNQGRTDAVKAISIENDPDYYLANGKVYDANTVLLEDLNHRKEIGVNIDIFPLDELPTDPGARGRLLRKLKLRRTLLSLKQVKVRKGRSAMKNAVLAVSQAALKPVRLSSLLRSVTRLSKSCSGAKDCGYLAAAATLIWGEKEIFRKEYFAETVKLEFEGRLLNAPGGYDSVLRQVYGDYMQLPPEKDRVSHHSYQVYMKDPA